MMYDEIDEAFRKSPYASYGWIYEQAWKDGARTMLNKKKGKKDESRILR